MRSVIPHVVLYSKIFLSNIGLSRAYKYSFTIEESKNIRKYIIKEIQKKI